MFTMGHLTFASIIILLFFSKLCNKPHFILGELRLHCIWMHLTSFFIVSTLRFVVVSHFKSFYILLQRIVALLNSKKYIMHWFTVGTCCMKDIAHITQRFWRLITKGNMKFYFFMVSNSRPLERNMERKFQHVVKYVLSPH